MHSISLNWLDICILAVISLSTLISVFRGFFREAISLTSWILAAIAAVTFGDELGSVFKVSDNPLIELLIGGAIIFISILILGAFVSFIITKFIKVIGLGFFDRVIGILFGVVRGVLIITIIVIIGMSAEFTSEQWWQDSWFLPYFETIAKTIVPLLPEELTNYLKF